MEFFDRARQFVYRNARPLDLARWQYHFEGGSRENVLTALAAYQNADGGFGHAIEPDNWSPYSTPIGTWKAISHLREIGMEDVQQPMMRDILEYLGSGADFADGQWRNTVPGGNEYPHAIWWEYREGSPSDYNPTASLAGFLLRYAPGDSELYALGSQTAREAVDWYMAQGRYTEQHVLRCFVELWEYVKEADAENVIDIAAFEEKIRADVQAAICHDASKWATEYVCMPSQLITSRKSGFYADNVDAAESECDFIIYSQESDGAYPVTWLWHNDYKEFEIAANWWRSDLIIRHFLYLKAFGRL